ncbi:3'-5' exonuclease [Bacillus sp. FJAT-49736]|uniref:3'-5' exonuclease n=1 Tax=Bacillus sp. FJAT-49736 TaxID=2833582 RepID=UPI001BC9D2E3|nr:3'-5' exonuclease [Bacillus sp. FJAT-49736]MBS4174843.1 3'-5' exonuclease [Bacillus sp. FJAT-49736]
MKNFIAFDFETANRNRHSICSVGMVFVESGKIVDSVYSLIDPEESFDYHNIVVHGIHPEDVEGAPTFNIFYETIKNRIESQVMVAHFLPFDGYALRDNLNRYDVTPVSSKLLCSYQLSKRLLKELSSHTLKSLCNHYEIDLIHHHNALDDARACAELMISLSKEFELHDLTEIHRKTGIRAGEITSSYYRSSLVSKKLPSSDAS